MEQLKYVETSGAPEAIGPYSQAIIVNGMVYCSGQIPFDPETMKQVEGGVEAQTEQVLRNLSAVLEAAGSSLGQVVKTTVFLKDMDDFAAMNAVYARFFGDHRPARAAVQAARLPRDVDVEIECIARV